MSAENQKQECCESAIYIGEVWHKRYVPRAHSFRYKVFMVYLDLTETDAVFSLSPWWSRDRRWYPASFSRADYFVYKNNAAQALDDAVKCAVEDALDFRPQGPVRLLTNLRYLGYLTNPISVYYCFDVTGNDVEAVLLQVTNTPWGERQHYVLDYRERSADENILFDKCMHVSPFIPMNIRYQWAAQVPGETLTFRLTNWLIKDQSGDSNARHATLYFSGGVNFTRYAMSPKKMRSVLIRFPVMTVKVIAAIYWQALRLKLKGIRFLPHPDKTEVAKTVSDSRD